MYNQDPDEDYFDEIKSRRSDYDDDDEWRADMERDYGEEVDTEEVCDQVVDVEENERHFYEDEDFSDPDNPLGLRD